MPKTEEEKAFDDSLVILEKAGMSVRRLGDDEHLSKMNIDVIKTGSLGLDSALGVGGYPRGRIIEMFGLESSGKSTMALLSVAEAQKAGGIAAYIDAEHGFNASWAKKLGVTDDLMLYQPDYGEQVFEVIEKLASNRHTAMIVVDSTAALLPKAELEESMEQKNIGMQAQLISKGLRKIVGIVGKSPTVVIFINQIRKNVMQMYGDPNTTPGGLALRFYCSVRIRVSKLGGKDNVYSGADGNEIGHRVKCQVVKNKVASPGRSCEFDLYFSRGISPASEILDLALAKGVIILEGRTYKFQDTKWIGKPAFESAISTDPKLVETLKEKINAKMPSGEK